MLLPFILLSFLLSQSYGGKPPSGSCTSVVAAETVPKSLRQLNLRSKIWTPKSLRTYLSLWQVDFVVSYSYTLKVDSAGRIQIQFSSYRTRKRDLLELESVWYPRKKGIEQRDPLNLCIKSWTHHWIAHACNGSEATYQRLAELVNHLWVPTWVMLTCGRLK